MNITLKPEQEQFIQQQLKNGRYESVDEAIAQAFQLLEEDDRQYQQWLEETRQKVAVGIEQANRGKFTDGKLVIARLREKLQQKRENQG